MIVNTEIVKHDLYAKKLYKMGIERGKGLRQGMPISPFLANIVLSDFDRHVEKRAVPMIRYADDILLMFDTEQKARDGFNYISDLLAKLSLTLPGLGEGSKTQIVAPKAPFGFLGRKIMYSERDGRYHAYVSNKQMSRIAHNIQSRYSLSTLLKDKKTFHTAIVDLNTTINTYLGVYRDAENFLVFRDRMKQARDEVSRRLFEELFGEGAVERLSPDKRVFLAVGSLQGDDAVEAVGE